MTVDRLSYTPQSHKGIQPGQLREQIAFATDELAILSNALIERGVEPAVVTEAFIEVVGTIRKRIEVLTNENDWQ